MKRNLILLFFVTHNILASIQQSSKVPVRRFRQKIEVLSQSNDQSDKLNSYHGRLVFSSGITYCGYKFEYLFENERSSSGLQLILNKTLQNCIQSPKLENNTTYQGLFIFFKRYGSSSGQEKIKANYTVAFNSYDQNKNIYEKIRIFPNISSKTLNIPKEFIVNYEGDINFLVLTFVYTGFLTISAMIINLITLKTMLRPTYMLTDVLTKITHFLVCFRIIICQFYQGHATISLTIVAICTLLYYKITIWLTWSTIKRARAWKKVSLLCMIVVALIIISIWWMMNKSPTLSHFVVFLPIIVDLLEKIIRRKQLNKNQLHIRILHVMAFIFYFEMYFPFTINGSMDSLQMEFGNISSNLLYLSVIIVSILIYRYDIIKFKFPVEKYTKVQLSTQISPQFLHGKGIQNIKFVRDLIDAERTREKTINMFGLKIDNSIGLRIENYFSLNNYGIIKTNWSILPDDPNIFRRHLADIFVRPKSIQKYPQFSFQVSTPEFASHLKNGIRISQVNLNSSLARRKWVVFTLGTRRTVFEMRSRKKIMNTTHHFLNTQTISRISGPNSQINYTTLINGRLTFMYFTGSKPIKSLFTAATQDNAGQNNNSCHYITLINYRLNQSSKVLPSPRGSSSQGPMTIKMVSNFDELFSVCFYNEVSSSHCFVFSLYEEDVGNQNMNSINQPALKKVGKLEDSEFQKKTPIFQFFYEKYLLCIVFEDSLLFHHLEKRFSFTVSIKKKFDPLSYSLREFEFNRRLARLYFRFGIHSGFMITKKKMKIAGFLDLKKIGKDLKKQETIEIELQETVVDLNKSEEEAQIFLNQRLMDDKLNLI